MPSRKFNEEISAKYSDRLDNEVVGKVQTGPAQYQQRSCTDIVCLIIFILVVIVYLIFFVYFLINGTAGVSKIGQLPKRQDIGYIFARHAGPIIGMIACSVVFSVIFVILCAKFPKCVVYSGIIFTFVCYLAIIILGFIIRIWALAISMIIVALVTALFLYCFRQQIKIGIALLKASGTFMFQKPSIGLIGFFSLIINTASLVLYMLGYIMAYSKTIPQYNDSQSSRNTYGGMIVFYLITGIYFSYFLYYLMVFVLSSAVAHWYYQINSNILKGYIIVSKHVGSLAFASLIITIVVVLRMLVQNAGRNTSNLFLKIILCFTECLMRCIQGFIEIINHNSIIVMSITGENFFNCAKTALGLIARNFGLYYIVDFIVNFIQFYSFVVCVLLPSLVCGLIIWSIDKNASTSVIGGIIVCLLACLITWIILGILFETLSAVFILYCFDKKLRQKGFSHGNLPESIRSLFNSHSDEQQFDIVHRNNQLKPPQSNSNLNKQRGSSSEQIDHSDGKRNSQKQLRKRKLNRQKLDQKKQSSQQIHDNPYDNYPQNNNPPNHPYYS